MMRTLFLKSSQISRDNFRFNILYEDLAPDGIGDFTDGPKNGLPLIEVFGLDRMDASLNYKYSDGVFDWLDSAAYAGGIIQPSTGRIYFPYVEPFGKDLRALLGNDEYANKYCFDSLYTMTQTLAQQYADKNKFFLEGYFSSSVSGDISLGYSVTSGSVTVTAGGVPLIENVDYTVDYTMGVVHIINESILSSGTPISVSSETTPSTTTKRMLGAHINYEAAPDFNIGATFMNLHEKPLTEKNNYGEEPTSNSIYGFDLNYKHLVPFITRLVDMLPGIQTKAPSTLTLQSEFAQLVPGISKTGSSENDVSYIDDFEGAENSIDLKTITYWHWPAPRTTQACRCSPNPTARLATGTTARSGLYRIETPFRRVSLQHRQKTQQPTCAASRNRNLPNKSRVRRQQHLEMNSPTTQRARPTTTTWTPPNTAPASTTTAPWPTPKAAGAASCAAWTIPTLRRKTSKPSSSGSWTHS